MITKQPREVQVIQWNNPNARPPIVIPTALDRAAEAERMAAEVRAEENHEAKVELALRLADFILAGPCNSPES